MIGNEKVEYTVEGLKQLIDKSEVISFDIFDTLVMRTVYFNHDVFKIVAKKYREQVPNFYEVRVRAEKQLSLTEYPYIEAIYDYIARECQLDGSLAFEIMNYEIDVERKVIVPRDDVVDIFNYCKSTGKRVYIVSDMYIHKKELEEIINNLGIVGYDKIFVSCEYNTSKPQHLFECYKHSIKADSYLHIGDSFICDIEASKKLGIDSFRLKTSAEIWESLGGVASENLEERTGQAEYICSKYNSPFA